jgi:hypothetical protein
VGRRVEDVSLLGGEEAHLITTTIVNTAIIFVYL